MNFFMRLNFQRKVMQGLSEATLEQKQVLGFCVIIDRRF